MAKVMKNQSAAASYMGTQVKTADQGKLILMLYDGAIGCLERGKAKIKDKRYEDKHKLLSNAEAIVFELMEGLNFEAGELAKQLFRIYHYMVRRIMQANLSCDIGAIDEVIGLLKNLRDGWRQILTKPIGERSLAKGEPRNANLRITT